MHVKSEVLASGAGWGGWFAGTRKMGGDRGTGECDPFPIFD